MVNHFPARGAIRDLLEQATGRAFGGPGFLALETPAFFGSTLALALLVTDLGALAYLTVQGNVLDIPLWVSSRSATCCLPPPPAAPRTSPPPCRQHF